VPLAAARGRGAVPAREKDPGSTFGPKAIPLRIASPVLDRQQLTPDPGDVNRRPAGPAPVTYGFLVTVSSLVDFGQGSIPFARGEEK
jgi:hypothetical protein